MKRREFLKISLKGILSGSFPLIHGCGVKSPVTSSSLNDGHGKLLIETEKDTYVWQLGQSESQKTLNIYSTVKNISHNTYYSQVGDRINSAPEQERLSFAENSAGFLEKYNEKDCVWNETALLGILIEGSRFVFLKPSGQYTIDTYLRKNINETEKGIYRFRIDYYDNLNPDIDIFPYRDYSNVFEIIDIIK